MADRFDVAIIGGGLAGLTAAIYAARGGLKTVILEKMPMPGGQIVNIEKIEDFPGFVDPIPGAELAPNVQDQATKAGAEFRMAEVTGVSLKDPYRLIQTTEGDIQAKAVIIATGSNLRKLGVAREEELFGRGVSQCASCDGNFFMDQVVAVVGGGDAAMDEALVLTEYASKILIFHRGDKFRASKASQDPVLANPKVKVYWNSVVEEIIGEESVTGVRVKDLKSGAVREEAVQGVFVFIGLDPATQFLDGVVQRDPAGHIPVDISMQTGVPGIFAAGDLRQHSARQLVTSAGDGATAALAAVRYVTGRSWPS